MRVRVRGRVRVRVRVRVSTPDLARGGVSSGDGGPSAGAAAVGAAVCRVVRILEGPPSHVGHLGSVRGRV